MLHYKRQSIFIGLMFFMAGLLVACQSTPTLLFIPPVERFDVLKAINKVYNSRITQTTITYGGILMAHILVRQNIEDFNKWKASFDGDGEFRKNNGSLGGHVFQSASDPKEVFVLLEWDSMDTLQQFAQSDELKARMQEAGVVGPPDIYFLNLSYNASA